MMDWLYQEMESNMGVMFLAGAVGQLINGELGSCGATGHGGTLRANRPMNGGRSEQQRNQPLNPVPPHF